MTAYPLLVADIGGTNARFAFVTAGRGDKRMLTHRQTFRAEQYSNLAAAAQAYLATWDGPPPQRAALAVAGPTGADIIQFTNSPWAIDRRQLAAALNIDDLRVVNDFEAQALGVRFLDPGDFVPLKTGTGDPSAPIVVLGPGTGLGLSILIRDKTMDLSGGSRTLATEGGHVAFAPQSDAEIDVLRHIGRDHAYVSFEHLLSGRGLVRIHRALCAIADTPCATLTAAEISRGVIDGVVPHAAAALEMFCAILGTYAGDAVLMSGARGGVYIAGGIVQKIHATLVHSAFAERFCARGAMVDYMADVPVHLITIDDTAFWGAASVFHEERRRSE